MVFIAGRQNQRWTFLKSPEKTTDASYDVTPDAAADAIDDIFDGVLLSDCEKLDSFNSECKPYHAGSDLQQCFWSRLRH
eukprot:scaffold9782_cov150-Amphora_coffeaeformis.AAC.7